MRFPFASTLLIVCAGAGLVSWNATRFIGAQPKIRTKNIDFLPSPAVARALSLGHTNTLAKLRWIDSFAYFELQLERKDDTVSATGDSAFERLYRMLLGMDPHFVPFYQHASLNLGGILSRHGVVLSILQEGLLTLPHETDLWRMLASELQVNYKLEDRNPLAMDAFLAAWHAAELTDEGRQAVWDWKKSMAHRQYHDLTQMPYWEDQLRLTKPGTAIYDFIVDTMREQMARYAEERLTHLTVIWQREHHQPPVLIADLLQSSVLTQAFPDGIPPLVYFPIKLTYGVPTLRTDPFGYAYVLDGGVPVSPGWQALRARKRSGALSEQLEAIAKREGRWPATLAEAVAAGLYLYDMPPNCHIRLDGKAISIDVDPPRFPAWKPPQAQKN